MGRAWWLMNTLTRQWKREKGEKREKRRKKRRRKKRSRRRKRRRKRKKREKYKEKEEEEAKYNDETKAGKHYTKFTYTLNWLSLPTIYFFCILILSYTLRSFIKIPHWGVPLFTQKKRLRCRNIVIIYHTLTPSDLTHNDVKIWSPYSGKLWNIFFWSHVTQQETTQRLRDLNQNQIRTLCFSHSQGEKNC